MAQRYVRRYSLPENQYIPGAPVLLAAGALLFDNETGKTLVQLKFQNLDKKAIVGVTVSIAAVDKAGNALAGVDTYSYTLQSVFKDMTFGASVPLVLPDARTASFHVVCKSVLFIDGSKWENDGADWQAAPKTMTVKIDQQKAQSCTRKALLPAGLILTGALLCLVSWATLIISGGWGWAGFLYYIQRAPDIALGYAQEPAIALILFGLLLIAFLQKWGKKKSQLLGIAALAAVGVSLIAVIASGDLLRGLLLQPLNVMSDIGKIGVMILPSVYVIAAVRNANPKVCQILWIVALVVSVMMIFATISPVSVAFRDYYYQDNVRFSCYMVDALGCVLYTAGGFLSASNIRTFQHTRR